MNVRYNGTKKEKKKKRREECFALAVKIEELRLLSFAEIEAERVLGIYV